jgi:nucleotide-binding universal stress UspA family protein
MPGFHNILVAVDFSQTSDDALSMAAYLGKADHAQVHLLHVVPDVVQSMYTMVPVAFDVDAYQRQSVEDARAQLPALAARYRLESAMLTTAVLLGVPAAEIVRYAEEHGIDLIVLGAHGHGFLDRLLIGSVAERVARRAPCAVLMVPHVARRLTSFEVKAAAGVEA